MSDRTDQFAVLQDRRAAHSLNDSACFLNELAVRDSHDHAVFGILLASTLTIIPLHYDGARDVIACLIAAMIGALAAYWSAKIQPVENT